MYQDIMDTIGFVEKYDSEVGQAMDKELKRQQRNLELIASENIVSPAVMAAMGSILTNKYAEGYPGKRYYGGCQYVDIVEDIARERACELFGAEHANVQPHSGAQANMAVYFALLKPGDTVMGMSLSEGGHLTHGSPVNISGSYYNFVSYGVDAETHRIDYDKLTSTAEEGQTKNDCCRRQRLSTQSSILNGFVKLQTKAGAISYGRYGAYCRTGCSRRTSKPCGVVRILSQRRPTKPCAAPRRNDSLQRGICQSD